MSLFVVFLRHEPVRPTSNHETFFQISPPETIHDEVDGVCHILPFRPCLTFTWTEREMYYYYYYIIIIVIVIIIIIIIIIIIKLKKESLLQNLN